MIRAMLISSSALAAGCAAFVDGFAEGWNRTDSTRTLAAMGQALERSARENQQRAQTSIISSSDGDWAWDLQRNLDGSLVWVCRGAMTGATADAQRCAFKPRNDYRWPGLVP